MYSVPINIVDLCIRFPAPNEERGLPPTDAKCSAYRTIDTAGNEILGFIPTLLRDLVVFKISFLNPSARLSWNYFSNTGMFIILQATVHNRLSQNRSK